MRPPERVRCRVPRAPDTVALGAAGGEGCGAVRPDVGGVRRQLADGAEHAGDPPSWCSCVSTTRFWRKERSGVSRPCLEAGEYENAGGPGLEGGEAGRSARASGVGRGEGGAAVEKGD